MKCCGECKYNKYDRTDQDYYCGNDHSDNYGCNTAYSDCCEDYEEKGNYSE